MKICQTIESIRETLAPVRNQQRIALVPTMGNLHQGHLSLVEKAKHHADKVVVSIFVNPRQFGPNEDLHTYPRTLDSDLVKLEQLDVDYVFVPEVNDIYRAMSATNIDLLPLSQQLCGASRPQFFPGVMLVVNKLFNIIQPDVAVFGDKDFQQLTIIKQMVRDLNIPVEMVSGATIREPDGLAMSSRNAYLSGAERDKASMLYQTLLVLRQRILDGEKDYAILEEKTKQALDQQGFVSDYIAVRVAETLTLPDDTSDGLIILAAASLGKTRLIDNLRV